jgi:hypothetical protein
VPRVFFVSVASKGVRDRVSRLFATLRGLVAYVLQRKELGRRGIGEKVTGRDGKILEGFEGLPGGQA